MQTPFFAISLTFMKSEISATFSSDKVESFLGFLPDITPVNFLKLLFYFTSHENVKIRNFSSYFSFSPLSSKWKNVDLFSPFFVGPTSLAAVKKRRETQINVVAALILLHHFKFICC